MVGRVFFLSDGVTIQGFEKLAEVKNCSLPFLTGALAL